VYCRNRFHEVSEKWIREHRQEYRGNRTGDLQDAYIQHVNQVAHTNYFVEILFLKIFFIVAILKELCLYCIVLD